MPPLSIYLFGVPRFERQEAPIHIPRRKAIALLAYLATTAQPHSRDALGTMFWPESDQSSARANLRRELSRIKSALGDQPFEIHQEQVGLKRESWWLDIETFQTSLKDTQAKLLNGSANAQEGVLSK